MWLAGIDLAGKPENKTAICLYETKTQAFVIKEAYSDEHIFEILEMFKPKIIAIDAPLHDLKNQSKAYRLCEKQLIERGYRLLTLKLPAMHLLYERARKLLPKLVKYGEVLECFASASLSELKITPSFVKEKLNKQPDKDEVDAFACCLTAYYYQIGKYERLGDQEEGYIVLPKLI